MPRVSVYWVRPESTAFLTAALMLGLVSWSNSPAAKFTTLIPSALSFRARLRMPEVCDPEKFFILSASTLHPFQCRNLGTLYALLFPFEVVLQQIHHIQVNL